MDKLFYVYVWYKDDEPIYVGKGKNKRAYRNNDVDVEIYQNNLTEHEAFDLEKVLICRFGRKDKGEGSLLNLTDGGGIAFSTLYWKGEPLKVKHREGIIERDAQPLWMGGAVARAKHATATRQTGWQDSVYLIKTPDDNIVELKTQEVKQYCVESNLDFDQLKHIARKGPVKRSSSRHYGYLVECLYNKVTGHRQDKSTILEQWRLHSNRML